MAFAIANAKFGNAGNLLRAVSNLIWNTGVGDQELWRRESYPRHVSIGFGSRFAIHPCEDLHLPHERNGPYSSPPRR